MECKKPLKKNLIAVLMVEHRVIERMVALISGELERIEKTGKADAAFVGNALDFFREFADQCHHGKEEDILFRELGKKDLSVGFRKMMDELIDEHKRGRVKVKALREALEGYKQGSEGVLPRMVELLGELVEFYPRHIEKEDKHFFLDAMRYFSKEESEVMFEEGEEFERSMPHEEFEEMVDLLEKERKAY